jgi:hypothetical protein
LRISTPSTAVTPRPAATLACTRKSGRSRRARKASRKPRAWQERPMRYVRWPARRSRRLGSNVWWTVVRVAAIDWRRLATPYAKIIAVRKHQPPVDATRRL